MSFLICDRCGDVTVDAASCWCGATVEGPAERGVRHRDDAPKPAGPVADDPARRRWAAGTDRNAGTERTARNTGAARTARRGAAVVPRPGGPVDAPRASTG